MATNEPSQAFWNLHNRLHAIVRRQQHETDKLHLLPLTAFQLAREAEGFAEFEDLVLDLFDPHSHHSNVGDLELSDALDSNATDDEQDDAWYRYEAEKAEWEARLGDFKLALADLLKRSGYYHTLLSGEDNVTKYYSLVSERIPAKHRIVTKLYLLDGCKFFRDRFDVADIPVTRISASELEELGPSAAVCEEFFPNESIASERISTKWFLKLEEDEWTAYDYDRWEDTAAQWDRHEDVVQRAEETFAQMKVSGRLIKPRTDFQSQREIAAGVMASRAAIPALPKYLDAVLFLSLYRSEFFELTRILICERGWRRISVRSIIPRGEKGSQREKAKIESYNVSEEQWPAFETYVNVSSSGLKNAKQSKEAHSVTTAVRRYLQATFATGDVFPEWEINSSGIEHPDWRRIRLYNLRESRGDVWEDALLHYVFALEALLTGKAEAIAEKVAISAALLIGRQDSETAAVRQFIKKAYDARSKLVHGSELKQDGDIVDIVKMRCICQRVLIVVLSLYAESPSLDLADLLRELPVSNSRQLQIKGVRDHILPLLSDHSCL
jgi:hypothetical protein